MVNELPIVRFGKYKNKSIIELIADRPYVGWLKKQPWFMETKIYNMIVNLPISTNIDSKTLEHNKLKNIFLEHENIKKFLDKIDKRLNENRIEFKRDYNWDWDLQIECSYECICNVSKFCDCKCGIGDKVIDCDIYVKIKLILSDDYPCILRKMKKRMEFMREEMAGISYRYRNEKMFVLFLKEFESKVTTKEQLIKIFKQSHIKVIFTDKFIDEENRDNALQIQNDNNYEELIERIKLLEEENKNLKTEVNSFVGLFTID